MDLTVLTQEDWANEQTLRDMLTWLYGEGGTLGALETRAGLTRVNNTFKVLDPLLMTPRAINVLLEATWPYRAIFKKRQTFIDLCKTLRTNPEYFLERMAGPAPDEVVLIDIGPGADGWYHEIEIGLGVSSFGMTTNAQGVDSKAVNGIYSAGFRTIRHVGHESGSVASEITTWDTRVRPGSGSSFYQSIALENQIDLCNQTVTDLWTLVPYKADDQYIRNMCEMIQQLLKPGLRVYLEYSNDYSFWFPGIAGRGFNYCIQRGVADIMPASTSMPFGQGLAWYVYRAIQVWNITQDIFGVDSMGTQVIRTLGAPYSGLYNAFFLDDGLAILKNSHYNRRNQSVDLLCFSADWGTTAGTRLDGATDTIARIKLEIDARFGAGNELSGVIPIKAAAEQLQIPYLGTYVQGPNYNLNAHIYAGSPIAKEAQAYALKKCEEICTGPIMLDWYASPYGSGSAGAIVQRPGDLLTTTPRGQAIKEWLDAHPEDTDNTEG